MPEGNTAIGKASVVQMHLEEYKQAVLDFRQVPAWNALSAAKLEMDRLVKEGLPPEMRS